MRRLLGWTFGIGCALALTATSAAAETRVSIGVVTPNGGARVEIGRPVYAPVYRVPVYRQQVYREPIYRPVYRERVIIVERRHDNGKHKGWHKHWRDERDERYARNRHRW